jgi:DNA-binding transcriptional MerR regulator
MASSRQPEDLLEPVDLSRRLRDLELTLGQTCLVAGVSKMQLDYWTTKAQIPTKGRKQRLYDMDAVETVMLIKQGKDKGLSLVAAIEAAARFKAARAAAGPAAQASRRTPAADSGASVFTK